MSITALDTETTEFSDTVTPRRAELKGISIAYSPDWAVYETDPTKWDALLESTEGTTVVGHHMKFDLLKLRQAGLKLPEKWEDTKIAATLINENEVNSLKPLSKKLLGKEVIEYKDLDKSNEEEFAKYTKNDALFTYELWHKMAPELDRQNLVKVYELEKSVVPVVQAMEDAGMLVDRAKLKPLAEFVGAKKEKAHQELLNLIGDDYVFKVKVKRKGKEEELEIAGKDFNANAGAHVAAIIYDKLGIKCDKTTKTGKRSVDKEALANIDHVFVKTYLTYKELATLDSGFCQKLPRFIEEDGRIHAEFNPLGAKATGRFSCSKPNIQQQPSIGAIGKKIRDCFIAPEGSKLIVADFSQMELRILAHFSEDPILIDAFNTNKDLHARTASLVFGVPEEEVTKDQRAIAKMANFAISYGITATGLYRRLNTLGIGFTQQECQEFINRYFNTYKGVKRFLNYTERMLKMRGFVQSLYKRRRRLAGRTPREVRQAQNFIIQGSGADLCKQAMVDVHNALPTEARIIAVVHDELIVEAPDHLAEQVRDLMVHHMSNVPNFRVPVKVDAKIGQSWGECK